MAAGIRLDVSDTLMNVMHYAHEAPEALSPSLRDFASCVCHRSVLRLYVTNLHNLHHIVIIIVSLRGPPGFASTCDSVSCSHLVGHELRFDHVFVCAR